MRIRITLFFVMAVAQLHAATLLDVGGTQDASFVLLDEDVVAVAFSLSAPATNVSVSAAFECNGCNAVAWITTQLDATYDLSALISAQSISGNPLFTGLSLGAGTHFLVISNTGVGNLVWRGSTNPSFSSDGATHIITWVEDGDGYNASAPPGSNFTFLSSANAPYYTVEEVTGGNGNEVPEPSTFLLSAAALIGFGYVRSRRSVS